MGEGALVGRWIVLVALGNVRATDDNLPSDPAATSCLFVHNGNLRTLPPAHQPALRLRGGSGLLVI